jgi:hypothetical protein
MNREDIIKLIEDNGLTLHGDIEHFAALVEAHVYAKYLEVPEPKLTGKFSITAGKFKCTGCTGAWTNRENAKHHLCKDYQ